MSAPQVYNVEWVRGTTETLVFRFKQNGVALSFDDARMSVNKANGKTFAFRLSIADGGIAHSDVENGEITISPTAEQTRMLDMTKDDGIARNKYEVELRNGSLEKVYVVGTISGIGGINDDEVEPS